MARWVVFHLLVAALMVSVSSLPDLTWDTRTEDIVHLMNSSEAEYIRHVRYETEDMPLECRTDICPKVETVNNWKGDISWPATQAGDRVYIRCPYSFDEERYAYYDCVLDDTLNATWADDVTMNNCPGPPLWEYIQEVIRNESALERKMESPEEIVRVLVGIHRVIAQYPDAPVSPDADELLVVIHYVTRLLEETEALKRKLLLANMDVVDFLINNDILYRIRNDLDKITGIIHGFTALTRLPSDHALLAPPALKSKNNRLMFARKTLYVGMEEQIFSSDDYSVMAELPHGSMREEVINVMYFDVDISEIFKRRVPLPPPPPQPPIPDGSDIDVVPIQPPLSANDFGFSSSSGYNSTPPLPQLQRTPSLTNWEYIYGYKLDCGILFVSVLNAANRTSGNGVIISHTYHGEQAGDMCVSTPYAESNKGNDRARLTTWYESNTTISCHLVTISENGSTCQCQLISGYLGIAGPLIMYSEGNYNVIHYKPQDSLAEFLGFPYSAELYIVGHVLRALSLVCLIVTLLSHIGLRTRRGRPTLILLHLCTSLTLLLILLYLAQVTAHTRTGCQVANVLRYYLVMVSLLWNAVEAYNMYLMLIKVFDQQTHRLVTKAALIAWGMPAVVIGIILAVNKKGFNGGYIDCEFRCFLPERTLYYGYLLPMSIIILHNLVIFSLVIRVLVNSANLAAESLAKRSRGHHWRQLSGAVAMLVLLGVPWFFSAFGAISPDASDAMKNTEAAFQIIFVLFVNIQGIFIFLFHCARNVDIRREWKSALSTASSRLSRGSSWVNNSSLQMMKGNSFGTSTTDATRRNQSPSTVRTAI